MIYTPWRTFQAWKILTYGVTLMGLSLIAARCNNVPTPPPNTPVAQTAPTATATENPPPQITGFTIDPAGPVFPDTIVKIQVNVNRNCHEIEDHHWILEINAGSIIDGQGTCILTYRAPKTPSSYEIKVQLKYQGGLLVEDSTKVEVILEPTSTPTLTPLPPLTGTATPTPIPTPTNTFTPLPPTAPIIPTPTPTPTKLPAPVPESPLTEEKASIEQGAVVKFKWNWGGRNLAEGEFFSIKVARDRDQVDCAHVRVTNTFFDTHVNCETSERYFWQVIAVRPILDEAGHQVGWDELSEPSEPQYFDYKKGDGNGEGGGDCESPPFCN